ncbi:Mycothiol acetyltransferase [uncultured archaeon]|nr:Mycothiol acetyltransferase [uncultured archaeon]
MKTEIVPASLKQVYSLKVLLKTFFSYSNQPEKIKENMKKGHSYYLLNLNGKTIGFIHFNELKSFYRLNGVAIDFPFRGQGFGDKLTKFLLDKAKKSHKSVTLLVDSGNESALKLYYKLGFKKVRVSKRTLNGSPLLLLRWTPKN